MTLPLGVVLVAGIAIAVAGLAAVGFRRRWPGVLALVGLLTVGTSVAVPGIVTWVLLALVWAFATLSTRAATGDPSGPLR